MGFIKKHNNISVGLYHARNIALHVGFIKKHSNTTGGLYQETQQHYRWALSRNTATLQVGFIKKQQLYRWALSRNSKIQVGFIKKQQYTGGLYQEAVLYRWTLAVIPLQ